LTYPNYQDGQELTRNSIIFLVVDDFGVKYQGKEHAKLLMNTLKEDFKISEDWHGENYIGLTLD